jgi:hypothetical protein
MELHGGAQLFRTVSVKINAEAISFSTIRKHEILDKNDYKIIRNVLVASYPL